MKTAAQKQAAKLTKQEKSWILYDWANSSYGIIVVTAVLPIWLVAVGKNAGYSTADTTAFWSYANSLSTLLVAIAAPVLGALADYAGYKQKLFTLFTSLGIVGTIGLALVPDNKIWWLLFVFMVANVGYSAANIFYDAYITDVTTDERMDRVSSNGYGFGYLGGVIPFLIFYALRGFMSANAGVMFGFVLAGVWWFGWTIPMWRNVRQANYLPMPDHPLQEAGSRIVKTVSHIAQYPEIAWFLLAYFFYIDGVNTIFTEASLFGKAVGIDTTTLLTVLLAVQLIAFPFSILYGRLAKKFNTRKVLIGGILVYVVIALYALFIENAGEFWVLAILVGTSQGGVQALSRAYFGRLVPKDHASEFFGFYNIFGKFSAILGPVLFGAVAQLTGRVQIAAGSLIILFGLGLGIFLALPKLVAAAQAKQPYQGR